MPARHELQQADACCPTKGVSVADQPSALGGVEATATIDNGEFGTRTVRFETGRLAQQAAGSVVAYLDDDTMLLSATTRRQAPARSSFDFFPLTVDVEERMYAAGRIPGSFFRREGRPSEDAILTCRLIDRPLRPTFVKGLRNEIQVVITVLALNPDHLYDVVAINAASMSTQLAGPAVLRPDRRRPGRPDRGPVGRVPDPRRARAGRPSTWSSPAGCSTDGDVAIMMVEAEATDEHDRAGRRRRDRARPRRSWPQGLEAAKPFIAELCQAQAELAAKSPPSRPPSSRSSSTTSDDVFEAVAAAGRAPSSPRR